MIRSSSAEFFGRRRLCHLALVCVVAGGCGGRLVRDDGVDEQDDRAFSAKINFQNIGAPVPAGYIADEGGVYGARNGLTYGWNSDHTSFCRDRNLIADQRLDTLCHFRDAQTRWELAVPNGTYDVTVSVGDAGYTSDNTIIVEGVTYWTHLRLGADKFASTTKAIVVDDGRLTIANGANAYPSTKINYVEIDTEGGRGGAAPAHVLTWDYYDNQYGASPSMVPVATAAKWLSWSNPSEAASTELAALGVKSYLYSGPTALEPPSDEFYAALVESDFAHDCSDNRITVAGYTNLYVTDPHSTHLANAWKNWVASQKGTYAAIFMEGGGNTPVQPLSSTPCTFSLSDWNAHYLSMVDALGQPVMFNGVWPQYKSGKWTPPETLTLLADPNIIGARMEGCYTEPYNPNVDLKVVGAPWQIDENTQLTMGQHGKLLLCMAGFNTPIVAAATALDVRAYVLASFFLSYDPKTSLLGEGFSTPSGFHVEPESQIVPLHPLAPAPSDISALAVGGVYVREYADCYLAGRRVSGCAAVVNASATMMLPFPATARHYAHTMVLTGGGVLDGGTVAVNGPAPPTSLAPATGIVVFE